jgi:tRNA1Val (adenine37-N6)-methyltransferase
VGTFRFKQFAVTDDRATMKVGTDAVLLGAWCPVGNANRILDIGTGSGVIALMLAQRSVAGAHIDAVELNTDDAQQAQANVQGSAWPSKVRVIHSAIQDHRPDAAYGLVVTNPPYFSNSLLPPEIRPRYPVNPTRSARCCAAHVNRGRNLLPYPAASRS